MGMTRTVELAGEAPAWPVVASRLAAAGSPVQMRMIDGQLAAPDEQPPQSWRELRVSGGGTMVTLRKAASGIELVTWGNADAASLALRDAIAAALEGGPGM